MLTIEQLKEDSLSYQHLKKLNFVTGDIFGWNNITCTIQYDPGANNMNDYLLHEYAHAVLKHNDYSKDIQLLDLERDAWEKATDIGRNLNIPISPEVIKSSLDTYRDWLHARSLCPKCTATGIQESAKAYKCLACGRSWKVNEARSCALRRYSITKNPIL